MDEMIRLTIQGKPVSREAASRAIRREAPEEEFPKGAIKVTRDQSYELATPRAGDVELTTETLHANDAVSLTLTDGHVVWLPAGDLPELLQSERGQPLVLSASTRLRLRTEQRGPISIGIRILRVFGFDIEEKASESLTGWISDRVEKRVLNETSVYRCRFTRNGMDFERESANLIRPESPEQPVLVLLHGTASNTAGSFSGLWTRYFAKWEEVVSHYKGHVYALEHRTLTESPASNACVLLDALAHEKQVVHLISHSRGGIVGELLCRSMVTDGSLPLTSEEVRHVVDAYSVPATASAGEQQAAEETRDAMQRDLEELAFKLESRRPRIERFVRVACPARGTGLADERLDFLFNMLLWGAEKLGKSLPGDADLIGDVASSIRTILLRTIKNRLDPRVLPGLESMVPGSPLQQLMNYSGRKLEGELAVIAGDADVALNPMQAIATALLNLYYQEPNDWVVETDSMTGGHDRLRELRLLKVDGGNVNHFSYFQNEDTANALMTTLSASLEDAGFRTRSAPLPLLPASRRGKAPLPTLFFVPGFAGSHLRHGESERIWLDADVITGDLAHLGIDNDEKVITPEALVSYLFSSAPYGKFVRHLGGRFRVQPFPYDWRLDMQHNSDRFAARLRAVLAEDPDRRFPLHIVCHSTGGLVALYTILEEAELWDRICRHRDSRLILAGTPLRGTFNAVQWITGSHGLVRFAAGIDQCHRHEELIALFRRFPGLLQALPRSTASWNFFHADSWKTIRSMDKREFPWQPPEGDLLEQVAGLAQTLEAIPAHAERIHYVAGTGRQTPNGLRFTQGGELRLTTLDRPEGDGLALWEQSIPGYAQTWVLPDVEHGSLFDRSKYFPFYDDLLREGSSSRVTPGLPAMRDLEGVTSRDIEEQPVWIQPDTDDLLRALMAGGRAAPDEEEREGEEVSVVAKVRIVHGDLGKTRSPLIVGHYEGDTINGTERALDSKVGGLLLQRAGNGAYPGAVDSVEIFTSPGDAENTAVVVGLGRMGLLTGPKLRSTFANALVRFSLHRQEQARFCGTQESLPEISSLVVGSGIGGLPIQQALTSLLRGLVDANQRLKALSAPGIGRLTFIELFEDTAIRAARVLQSLIPDFGGRLDLQAVIRQGAGGVSAHYSFQSDPWWKIVHIQKMGDAMVFSPLSERGAAPTFTKVNQQELVDTLVERAISNTARQSRLGKTLFEVLIPHNYKEDVADQQGIQILLDEYSARFPWEMLQDRDSRSGEPVAVRTGIVRQLMMDESPPFRDYNLGNSALIIADTLGDLAGARAEAKQVEDVLTRSGYRVDSWVTPDAAGSTDAVSDLLIRDYRILHFATHGEVHKDDRLHPTALVMGEGIYLLPETIASLRRVPELVFFNCCHLARTDVQDEKYARDRHILAAGIATAFLKLGARAVIAAGWAVDDDAAEFFSRTFYDNMLRRGMTFGAAIQEARRESWKQFPDSNTWCAYQCYGEASFRLAADREKDPCPMQSQFHAPSEFAAWIRDFQDLCRVNDKLTAFRARLKRATSAEKQWISNNPVIQEAMGYTLGDLGAFREAADYYDMALENDEAAISLKGVEQACNLSVRWVEQTLKSPSGPETSDIRQMLDLFRKAIRRIEGLIKIGDNAERLSLLASAYKHRAVIRLRLDDTTAKSGFDDLAIARDYYNDANERTRKESGKDDSYPLLNAVVLDCLRRRLRVSNVRWKIDEMNAMLDRLAEAIPPGSTTFWHRTDRLNIRMVRALVENSGDRDEADALAADFMAEFEDEPVLDIDSVVKQIRFIHEILAFNQKSPARVQVFFERFRESLAGRLGEKVRL